MRSNVYLGGFMGSGKTTVGKLLAKRTGMRFRDSDWEVRSATGLRPAQWIRNEGVAKFREIEFRVLRKLSRAHGQVVALGGGVSLAGKRWARVRGTGIVIYLACSPRELLGRIRRGWRERPLLGNNPPEIPIRVKTLLAARRRGYERADWKIDTTRKTPAEVADAIVGRLRRESVSRAAAHV